MQSWEIVIGFDFECPGGIATKNGFTQLGASVHLLATGEKIASFNEYTNMEGFEWDQACIKRFWNNNIDQFEQTKKNIAASKLTCEQVIERFVTWVKMHAFGKNVVMISDSQLFDGGLLRHFMKNVEAMYLTGSYTTFVDVSSYYYGMAAARLGLPFTKNTDNESSLVLALKAVNSMRPPGKPEIFFPKREIVHDHNAEHDAEIMVINWITIQTALCEMQAS